MQVERSQGSSLHAFPQNPQLSSSFWKSMVVVWPQTPFSQVETEHGVDGQSASLRHMQDRRPRLSFGPQNPEQHAACSVQVTPSSRQWAASPR
jgi:hypothetical protein